MTIPLARRNTEETNDIVLAGCALVLLGASAGTAALGRSFVYGTGWADRPLIGLVGILSLASIAHVAAVCRAQALAPTRRRTAIVTLTSILLPLPQLLASPIQAADFYRYLLDGTVTACGGNPYAYRPHELVVRLEQADAGQDPAWIACARREPSLRALAERVEYERIRTPYPALAQAWFGLVVAAGGASLTALRIGNLALHLLILVALAFVLRRLGRSPLLILAYGWSPLLFKETFNSAHYDLLPAFALTAAIAALVAGRHVLAGFTLGTAVAVKWFAAVLVPVFLLGAARGRRGTVTAVVLAGAVLPWLYFIRPLSELLEGVWTFTAHWEAGATVFRLWGWLASTFGAGPATARALAVVALAVTLAWIGHAARRDPDVGSPTRSCKPLLATTLDLLGALLLVGPVMNPWYAVWMLPLLAVHPRAHWLAFVAMQPLYYLRFWAIYGGCEDLLTPLAWLTVLPCLALLTVAAARRLTETGRLPAGG